LAVECIAGFRAQSWIEIALVILEARSVTNQDHCDTGNQHSSGKTDDGMDEKPV
jgi:hypothetical protein